MPVAVRTQRRPLVTMADIDFDRLDVIALAGEGAGHPVASFLAAELERAVIRPVDEIGPNIVRMNSRVAFRIGTRRDIDVRTLIYPEEYVRRSDRSDCVSVMTPLGAALLGLRVGASMSYETIIGTTQYVTVVAVLNQPSVERGSALGEGHDRVAASACTRPTARPKE